MLVWDQDCRWMEMGHSRLLDENMQASNIFRTQATPEKRHTFHGAPSKPPPACFPTLIPTITQMQEPISRTNHSHDFVETSTLALSTQTYGHTSQWTPERTQPWWSAESARIYSACSNCPFPGDTRQDQPHRSELKGVILTKQRKREGNQRQHFTFQGGKGAHVI